VRRRIGQSPLQEDFKPVPQLRFSL
jgi:hypothetical protein